jgi:cell division inhibitor SepF
MVKKKFLERISDALGLYDPDDPNRMLEEEEEDEEAEEEEAEEKPARRGFPKAVRPAPIPVVKEKPAPVAVEKEVKEKKPGLLSRVRKGRKQNRTIQMKTTTEVRVVVIEPSSFDDSQKVADFLRNDQPVVVNFETTEQTVRKRMTDFISGTIYALNGTIRTIGPNILVCAPRNVDIDAEAEVYGGERGGSSWPKN